MSSSRQQPQCKTPSPEYFIDLTVDSPVSVSSKNSTVNISSNSTNKVIIRHGSFTETIHDETIIIDDSDLRDRNHDEADIIDKPVKEKSKTKFSNSNHLNNELSTFLSCPICFEELMNSSIKAFTTKCGHIFCESCIQSSLQSRKKCPVCMASITLKSCIRLHL